MTDHRYSELSHPDANRRRSAAIRLGRTLDRTAIPALSTALNTELDDDVRASLILALGAIGGELAEDLLRSIQPKGPRDIEALSTAIDRVTPPSVKVSWAPKVALPNIYFEVPESLERPITRMFVKSGFPAAEVDQTGLIRCVSPIALHTLSPLPRWVYGIRLLLGEAKLSESVESSLGALVTQAATEGRWKEWLIATPEALIPYRFSIEGRNVSKEMFKTLLDKARHSLEPRGLTDRPTGYCVELVLSFLPSSVRLYLKPSFEADERFRYRINDVGASINPVVAAAIVRLIPMHSSGAIIDPTCGSGTLLVERAFMDEGNSLVGIDVSATACKAARENIQAANLSNRAIIKCGNALDSSNWSPCGLVLANLPFGIRIRQDAAQLKALYNGILDRATDHLSADGRVLLYSANRGLLEQSVARAKAFKTLARYRVQSGGLHVHIVVLGRAASVGRSPNLRKD